ncbi:MAG: helix-turn-helix domain-containing protein [Candidatus Zhuqueibacterota bacterium]
MDDLEKYIQKRKDNNSVFAQEFEEGYENIKIGLLLKRAREEAGITQEELAQKLNTKKSAISRIENHSEDIRLSTIKNYVEAVGKKLHLSIS